MATPGKTVLLDTSVVVRHFRDGNALVSKFAACRQPYPAKQIWIAAMALQAGLPLATVDHHFRHVDRLTVQLW